ncbi:ATP-binding protein [Ideonella sp. BN130291]|uniref:ATP-binding protein n=1 Tax=Ideonella sp. BN130291 TaxID=3112940 RepID=UPI002E258AEC|nr:ATP-binding protein [Ideonella sp. BN130291]
MALPPKPRRRERRLGPRLLAAIVLASSCLALVATAIQLYLDYSRDLSGIDAQFGQIESSYVGSVANSLWSVDKQQLQLQLDGLLTLRDVQFAKVQGQMGERFEAGVQTPGRTLVRQYVLHGPNAPRTQIGTLTVGIGLAGVYGRLVDRTLVILATQTAKTFFIALFILFIVSQWITRHLEHMARHARSLKVQALDRPLQLQRHSGAAPDELDDVASALNDMSLGLHAELQLHAEAQAELRRHRDHLEELVAERTAELQVAKERAEAASAAKTEFLSRMSHELRTPLNAILGYAQILKLNQGMSAERRAAGLDTIHTSGEHLLSLIVDMLDLSKIEAGRTVLQRAPVVLAGFLQGVADIISVRADAKGLRFVVQAAPDLPHTVEADAQRLRQVLLNLLTNAVKFTDAGQVTLSVRRGDSDYSVCFDVIDTGVGIAREHWERIFEPFEQVGDVQKRGGGTGLGLAISRQLVRLMGGDIHVDSRQGEGSRFGFTLALPAGRTPPVAAPACRRATGYEGRRRSVLVVDDVAGNRAVLADLLRLLDFEVREATDGQQALDLMAASLPDLVLMDMAMPGMNGIEATRRIRARSDWAGIPVIAVTAHASDISRQECAAAGASAYLSKPIDRDALFDLIGQQLGLRWVVPA